MSLSRCLAAVAAATLLALPGVSPALAGEVSMAGGAVRFHTPDNWQDIMQTEGDPEARVFQVPDPSPTGKNNLARVTVTVTQEPDVAGFNQYREAADAKAKLLPGYRSSGDTPAPNEAAYSANENGTEFSYSEHYWFARGRAIQLRCVRPAKSEAGSKWTAGFDHDCSALAAQLKQAGA
ncbi:MAG: hypothetical protein J0H50_14705 [Xanthomonadales bacterium]|nr:hypothetical protein [Xanthomonadales bacterium]